MPWNNQSGGGGWKGSNGGPWGQGPRNTGGGGPNQPDLEELLKRSQDRLRQVLPGGGGGGAGMNPLLVIGALGIGIAVLAFNFFTFRVEPDELGVVLRFGEFHRQADPGLNARLPYPIEQVYTERVTFENRENIGVVGDDRNPTRVGGDVPEESLMLTGDENIVDVDFTVVWVINDAAKFLFNLQNPRGTVKSVAESAMREVVGRSDIQPILTQARQITETAVQELMQETLDSYDSGISVRRVQLLKVDPPSEVIAAFRDVQAARADQERLQNEAQTYANRVVPEARGQASQITEAANAYRDRITAEARGQADRFISIYDEYRVAPDVTRQRIYLETLESVFDGMDKIIIDQSGGEGSDVVPYLPLNELMRRRSEGASQ